MTLRCELSKAGVPVEWRKEAQLLEEGGKYQMKQEGRVAEMTIRNVALKDAAEYSCSVGTVVTSADVKVRGKLRPYRGKMLLLWWDKPGRTISM